VASFEFLGRVGTAFERLVPARCGGGLGGAGGLRVDFLAFELHDVGKRLGPHRSD